MTTHLMLDIETLGTRPGFIVLSAALVRFSDLAATSIALDMDEQAGLGLEIDHQTRLWWSGQSDAARAAAFGSPVPLAAALAHISNWLAWAEPNIDDRLIWCHGASFDAPMLQEVYRRAMCLPCPWQFWNVRDTRTLYDLASVDVRPYYTGRAHIAIDDALAQTKAALDALRVLAGRRAAA